MTDYKPLIEEAREHIEHLAQGVPGAQADRIRRGESDDPRTALVVRLADALEALVAEKAEYTDHLREWESVGAPAWVAAKEREKDELRAERDALRAQLDTIAVTDADVRERQAKETAREHYKNALTWKERALAAEATLDAIRIEVAAGHRTEQGEAN